MFGSSSSSPPVLLTVWVLLFSWTGDGIVNAQFDFGGPSSPGNHTTTTCSGSGSFQQEIARGKRVFVGDIPVGLTGLRITLTSPVDVDIQLTSPSSGTIIEVINWQGGVLGDASTATQTWQSDSITYSGYTGDDENGPGHEYVQFNDETSNAYSVYAFGYQAGYATVEYSWTGQAGCTETDTPNADESSSSSGSGNGSFLQPIAQDEVVTVGELPAGLTDLYVRLDCDTDIDIQLYDADDKPIVHWKDGILNGDKFQKANYAGVEIQYSGYKGEQRPQHFGKEYLFLKGTLASTLSLRVLGYQPGTAQVKYSWGYYAPAKYMNDGSTLAKALHDIIDGHTELNYSPGVWEALMRTDQDPNNPDNVILLYSRRSEPKSNRDNGDSDPDAWNREHVYAKSHGDFGTSPGPGTDIHALRASDKTVNTERSSKDFANGGTELSTAETREDCPACRETTNSFEPPDVVKGDVARMIFYMAVRYNGDEDSNSVKLEVVNGVGTSFGSTTSNLGEIGDLEVLRSWHEMDPVSDEEHHRNNLIYDIQGNRNPFIDNPEFVGIIFA